MQLSVVIPVYNEAESVSVLYHEISAALSGCDFDYELLFVDDGSQDQTVDHLRGLAAADPRVRIVRFRRNCGQTAAIQAGFDLARGRDVVTMDGDLQNDPADIPLLMKELHDGCDVVTGWRKDRQDRAVTRKLPSVAANWLIGKATGVRIHDNGCTLKAYRRDVVKKARLYSEMHRFLVPMLSLSGCRIREVVVNHRARQFGSSKYGLSRIWKVFLDLLAVKMILRFASQPAVWFALFAVPFAVAFVLSGSISLIYYLAPGSSGDSPVVVPAITVLSVFATFHLLFLGIFAELVVKTGDFRESEPVLPEVRRKVTESP